MGPDGREVRSIFISHSGKDAEVAEEVARRLTEAGLRVSLDRLELRAGDDFVKFMADRLDAASHGLLLWSRAAAGSRYVEEEWHALWNKLPERAFVVGRLDDTELPSLLSKRVYVDLFPGLNPGLADLVSQLANAGPVLRAHDLPPVRAFQGTFVGRQEDLKELAALLIQPAEALHAGRAALVGLQGIGGVGKTALAMAFVERFKGSFPGGVLWGDLGSSRDAGERGSDVNPESLLRETVRGWIRTLGGEPDPVLSRRELLSMLQDHLWSRTKRFGRCLLVLDNVDDEATFGPLAETVRCCPILMTTRQTTLASAHGMKPVSLGALSPEEGRALIQSLLMPGDARLEGLEPVLRRVEHHPLAIHIIGALLKNDGALRPETVLEDLHRMSAGSPALAHIPRSLQDCFSVSIRRLPRNPVYPFLISVASQSPLGWSMEAADDVSGCRNHARTKKYISTLLAHGLIERVDERLFRMHRLLIDYIRVCHGAEGFGWLKATWEVPSLARLLMVVRSGRPAGTANYDFRQERYFSRLSRGKVGKALRPEELDGLFTGLHRRRDLRDPVATRSRLRVLGGHLAGADLTGIVVRRAMLDGACFDSARLERADLSGEPARLMPRPRALLSREGRMVFSGAAIMAIIAAITFVGGFGFSDRLLAYVNSSLLATLALVAWLGGIWKFSEVLTALLVSGGLLFDRFPHYLRLLAERLLVLGMTFGLGFLLSWATTLNWTSSEAEQTVRYAASVGGALCFSVLFRSLVERLSARVVGDALGAGGLGRRMGSFLIPSFILVCALFSLNSISDEPVTDIEELLLLFGLLVVSSWSDGTKNPELEMPLYSIRNCYLRRASLNHTNLRQAKLMHVRLQRASFIGADLTGADLTEARCAGAVMRNAALAGARLVRTDLSRADLRNVDLTGADLMGAKLEGALLEGVIHDTSTRWPDGYSPPPSAMAGTEAPARPERLAAAG